MAVFPGDDDDDSETLLRDLPVSTLHTSSTAPEFQRGSYSTKNSHPKQSGSEPILSNHSFLTKHVCNDFTSNDGMAIQQAELGSKPSRLQTMIAHQYVEKVKQDNCFASDYPSSYRLDIASHTTHLNVRNGRNVPERAISFLKQCLLQSNLEDHDHVKIKLGSS